MTTNPSDILLFYSDEISRRIVDAVGESNVCAVFLTGSTARGEIAAYHNGSVLEIYSDVDLYVVVNDGLEVDSIRSRARAVAEAVDREGAGYRIFAAPDVGVFSRSGLGRQVLRPGTFDTADSHRLLFGDSNVPREAPAGRASAIETREGLYLLENRLTEGRDVMEGRDEGGGAERFAHYIVLKSCLDAVSAALITLGRFSSSRKERMTVVREERLRDEIGRFIPNGSMDCIDFCYASLENLQESLPANTGRFETTEKAVTALLVDVWKRIASEMYSASDWATLVTTRCGGQGRRRNIRELMSLARRMSVAWPGVALASIRLGRFSPRVTLRLAGLVEGLGSEGSDVRRTERLYSTAVGELTHRFGFRDGTTYQRARRMYRAIV